MSCHNTMPSYHAIHHATLEDGSSFSGVMPRRFATALMVRFGLIPGCRGTNFGHHHHPRSLSNNRGWAVDMVMKPYRSRLRTCCNCCRSCCACCTSSCSCCSCCLAVSVLAFRFSFLAFFLAALLSMVGLLRHPPTLISKMATQNWLLRKKSWLRSGAQSHSGVNIWWP